METTAQQGQKNLVLLGVGAILIAGITTGLSLWVYRSSGDIYLDRSRPGYLPDEREVEEEASNPSSGYVFDENGEITKKDLNEYLEELNIVNDRIKALSDPYAPTPLSNASLGIPADTEKTPEKTSKQ